MRVSHRISRRRGRGQGHGVDRLDAEIGLPPAEPELPLAEPELPLVELELPLVEPELGLGRLALEPLDSADWFRCTRTSIRDRSPDSQIVLCQCRSLIPAAKSDCRPFGRICLESVCRLRSWVCVCDGGYRRCSRECRDFRRVPSSCCIRRDISLRRLRGRVGAGLALPRGHS
jgi:hypothetical protein